MSHAIRLCAIGAAALAALLAGTSAGAADALSAVTAAQEPPVLRTANTALLPPSRPSRPTASLLGVDPLDAKALATKRGGADVFNDMQLKGVVADNRAVNVTTGGNSITEGAFSNASGLPMVVQNSGNNVLIQNATIINVQVK